MQVPEAALESRPPGSRPPVCGQFPGFLESCSRAAPDRGTPGAPAARDQCGTGHPRPAGGPGEVRPGEVRGPGGCVSLVTWGLSRLSPRCLLGSFVLRAARSDRPGKEQGMGVGWLEHRGGLGGAWAGKAAPEPAGMCKNFYLTMKSEAIAPVSTSGPCAPSAPQTKVALGHESGASGTSPLAPATAALLCLPSPAATPPPGPKLSNFTGGSRGRGERAPGAPRNALGGASPPPRGGVGAAGRQPRCVRTRGHQGCVPRSLSVPLGVEGSAC